MKQVIGYITSKGKTSAVLECGHIVDPKTVKLGFCECPAGCIVRMDRPAPAVGPSPAPAPVVETAADETQVEPAK